MSNPISPGTHYLTFDGTVTDTQMVALFQRKYAIPPQHIIRWQTFVYAGPVPDKSKPDDDVTNPLSHP